MPVKREGDKTSAMANATDLCLMMPIFFDSHPSLLSLLVVLHPRGNSTDLDLLQWGGEIGIKRERIVRVDLTSWRMFLQNLEFSTCQGLQMSPKLSIYDRCSRLDFLLATGQRYATPTRCQGIQRTL